MPDKTFEEELIRTRAAMDKRMAEIEYKQRNPAAIQYNITFPVTQEQAERIIRMLEMRG